MVVGPCYVLLAFCEQGGKGVGQLQSQIMKYLTTFWLIFCLIWVIILLVDTINFVNNSFMYPIGTEGLTWKYKSEVSYLTESIIFLIWLLMPCVICSCIKENKKKWIIAHVLITFAYQIYIILIIYKL